MNIFEYVCVGIAIFEVLAAAVVIILYRQNTKRTLEKISRMIDTVIGGNFVESVFNESALSAVEAKLSRYLSMKFTSLKELSGMRITVVMIGGALSLVIGLIGILNFINCCHI